MPSARYDIVETIASGDFATVYRGIDHELKREVAIKQIHQQYLADPRQLDRYWQEAHLLASLQHPHVMTIYDIVRVRGWLILELMQGSLSQLLGGRPIDLKDLRLTLNYTLQALQAMHRRGILHGDVKPSNLLVDRNSRVKLGDFGIARHITGEGSVVKGTTKYIAPEVVSDQAGEVGPQSDIYSLGFTAYELMCGEHFESLFPGLNMYGRDRQIAWMMWHSAPDRRLPEIARVLDGVPADLAFIVQKMIEKDPRKRYRTTDEVLADLKLEGEVPAAGPTPEEQAAIETEARSARRRRSVAIGAAVASLVLSLAMLLFLPSGDTAAPRTTTARQFPGSGEIVAVDADRGRIFVKPENAEPTAVPIREGSDRIFLNGQRSSVRQLDRRDRVQIAESSSAGKKFLVLEVTRDAAQEASGTIERVDAGSAVLTLKQQDPAASVQYLVNAQAAIELNGQTERAGKPFHVADLRPRDQVQLRYKTRDDQRFEAATIRAIRRIREQGWVTQSTSDQLTIRLGETWDTPAAEKTFSIGPDCVLTLNGSSDYEGRTMQAQDLRPRDRVTIEYDVTVRQIDALRQVQAEGVIASIDWKAKTFSVQRTATEIVTYQVDGDTRIDLPGAPANFGMDVLRVGDQVTVRRKSPDPDSQEAALISVVPRYDPRTWVLIVEQAEHIGDQFPELPYVGEDAAALHNTLRFRYRVPDGQCLRARDLSVDQLRASVSSFAQRATKDSQLILCYFGLGIIHLDGRALLAANDFDPQRIDDTSVPLRWVLDQLEASSAAEKLLLLCTGRPDSSDAVKFASASELTNAARPRPRRPVSKSVDVVAATGPGEPYLVSSDRKRSVVALALDNAFSGDADRLNDQRISAAELRSFVPAEASRLAAELGKVQSATVFAADPNPPRLTDEAREAVARLLFKLTQPVREVPWFKYESAKKLCTDQPDADIAFALVSMRQDKSPVAIDILGRVLVEHPNSVVAYECSAWLRARLGDYKESIPLLEQLIRRLPASAEKMHAADKAYADHAIRFAGRLAAYALLIAPDDRKLTRSDLTVLEKALTERSPESHAAFMDAARSIRVELEQLDKQISEAVIPGDKSLLELKRANFNYYLPFDFEAVRQFMLASME